MILRGVIPKKIPSRNIGKQIAKIYESGVPDDVYLFHFTLPIDISPEKYSVLKYDHIINIGDNKIGLIKINKITYKSADGKVVLENKQGAGYLYFAATDNKKGNILEVWTQEILGVSDGDSFEIKLKKGVIELIN